MGANNVIKQMYEKKVEHLESLVLESQKKWSVLVSDFQSRGGVLNTNLSNKSMQKQENKLPGIPEMEINESETNEDDNKNDLSENKIKKKKKFELYFDSDVPEFNVFHADNMDDVNCHYVDVYNVNGDTETKKVKLKEALSDDEKEETLNSLVENNKKEKFNENIPKIGG